MSKAIILIFFTIISITADANLNKSLSENIGSERCHSALSPKDDNDFLWHHVRGHQPHLSSTEPIKFRYKLYGPNPIQNKTQKVIFIFSGLMTDLEKFHTYSRDNKGFINTLLQDKNTTLVAIELLGQGETFLQNKPHYGLNEKNQITPIETEVNYKLAAKVIHQLFEDWGLYNSAKEGKIVVEIFGKSYGGKIATSVSRYLDFNPNSISLYDPGVMTWFQFMYPELNFKPIFSPRAKESFIQPIAQKIMESLKTTLPENIEEWRLQAAAALTLGIHNYDGTRNILHIHNETDLFIFVPGQQDGVIPKLMTYQLIKSRLQQKGKTHVLFIPESPHNLYDFLNSNPKISRQIEGLKKEIVANKMNSGFYKVEAHEWSELSESDFLEFAIQDTEKWAQINQENIDITFSSLNSLLQWMPFLFQQGLGVDRVLYHAEKELESLRYSGK